MDVERIEEEEYGDGYEVSMGDDDGLDSVLTTTITTTTNDDDERYSSPVAEFLDRVTVNTGARKMKIT